jgi:hypothetical protein
MEKSGCGYVVGGVLALVLVAGIVFTGQCGGQQAQQQRTRSEAAVVAIVGEGRIYADDIEQSAQAQIQPLAQQLEVVPPEFLANAKALVLDQMIREHLVLHMARQRGVKLTDEELINYASRSLDEAIQQQRRIWEAEGKLKAGATDAEFEALVQKEAGRSLSEVREQTLSDLRQALQDPSQRDRQYAAYAMQAVIDAEGAKVQPTDEELRRSFNLYTFQRVTLSPDATRDEAEKILQEIRGGLGFEAAMNRYSRETPEEGQRVSDLTSVLTYDMMAGDPTYRPLVELQQGQVSEVIMLPSGPAIYRLQNVDAQVPEDLTQNIEEHRKSFANRQAQQRFHQELEEAKKTVNIEWRSEGYRVLYDWSQVHLETMTAPPAERQKALREIASRAAQAMDTDNVPMGGEAAALAHYVAIDTLWTAADETQRTELRQERIDSVTRVLDLMENVELRLTLVDLYAQEKNQESASRQLVEAARSNTSLGAMGQQFFNEINNRLERLRNQNLLEPGTEEQVQAEQERWRRERAEQEQFEEEQRRQEEEARKQAEAEQKAAQQPAERPSPTTTGGGTTGQ